MTCTRLMTMSRPLSTLQASPAIVAIFAALAFGTPGVAAADPKSEASQAVSLVVKQVIAVLSNGELNTEAKRVAVEEIARNNFDFPVITRLVLARNYKKLNQSQQTEFIGEFQRYLSLTYGRRVDAYSDQKVEIAEAKSHKNGDVTVDTKLIGGSVDGVIVAYRMRNDSGNWKAIDVIVEGVSMIANFRSQIQEIVSNKGADQLIATLREKNERDAAAETP